MMAGVVMLLMGWFRLGALVRAVPVPIVIGFTNGIAVLIALSQLKDFFGLALGRLPADFFALIAALMQAAHTVNPAAVAVACGSVAVVALWPRSRGGLSEAAPTSGLVPRLRGVVSHLPGTLVALVLATLAVLALALPVDTIGSRFGGIPQALPAPVWPELSWGTVKQLVIPTLTIALLGALESLLCARVADTMTELPRHDPNQELMAQGVANVVTPLFGGLPATGTIARTVTNVRAGATTPVAGIVHAAALLVVVLVAAPLAVHVPLPALAGILMFVAWNMGEWREFARLRRFSGFYCTLLLGSFVLTVVVDLTVAVEVGLVLACLFFIIRMSREFRIEVLASDGLPPGTHAVALYGSLFFAAADKLEALPSQLPAGTSRLVLDMHRLVLLDSSGAEALQQLQHSLQRQGVALVLVALNPQTRSLVQRCGLAQALGPAGLANTVQDVQA
jgi:sulfate permease, SulP family